MRIGFLASTLVFIASPLINNAAFAQSMALEINQAKPLILKKAATGVVVGNAGVADVIVHDPNTLIFTGKSVGTTNILILGEKGKTLYSGLISVSAPDSSNLLTIQRGAEVSTSACNSRCIEVPSPYATTTPLNDAVSRIRANTTFANGGGGAGGGGH